MFGWGIGEVGEIGKSPVLLVQNHSSFEAREQKSIASVGMLIGSEHVIDGQHVLSRAVDGSGDWLLAMT